MIINFSVEGFLSMHDKVDLYFIPVTNTRLTKTRFASNFLFTPKYKVMKSVVFFGANASGKSNLLLAIQRFKDIVLHGVAIHFIQQTLLDVTGDAVGIACQQQDFRFD